MRYRIVFHFGGFPFKRMELCVSLNGNAVDPSTLRTG